ncbi:MAG: EamA family transporter [Butyrivibrio sp.]|nr:EamA family transporter [Acetatifactor muris]MCM1558985.1 EamA family transporter [Butyrivibrio sp.]
MMLPYSFIFLMTIMGSVASLFLKQASGSLKGGNIGEIILNMLKTPSLYAGAGLYLAASVLNIYVLRILDYSSVLPMSAFTYVWTMFLARIRFGDKLTVKKMAGVFLVVAGAVLVSRPG